MRLGLRVIRRFLTGPCTACSSGHRVDDLGRHALRCNHRLLKNKHCDRHDFVRDFMIRSFGAWGVATKREPPVDGDNSLKRGNLTAYLPEAALGMCWMHRSWTLYRWRQWGSKDTIRKELPASERQRKPINIALLSDLTLSFPLSCHPTEVWESRQRTSLNECPNDHLLCSFTTRLAGFLA